LLILYVFDWFHALGAAEATAKPKQQRKRRKHKAQACTEGVRDDFDDDWEVF
jgi:hypothetical protein